MNFLFTLLSGVAFLTLPTLTGWFVWMILFGVLLYALFRWRIYQPAWKLREWGFFVSFLILIAFTSLFIGLRLSSASTRPPPGVPADAPGSALMVFSAIPLLLGGERASRNDRPEPTTETQSPQRPTEWAALIHSVTSVSLW